MILLQRIYNFYYNEKAAWEAQQPTVDPYREMTETEEEIQRRKDQRMDEHRDHVRRGDGNRKNMG